MKILNILLVVALFSITFLMSCGEDDPLSFEAQLEKDIAEIEAYLDVNEIPAVEDDSGIFYVIESPGFGSSPTILNNVKITYEGRLFSGEVFDTTEGDPEREGGVVFNLGELIAAWQIMLPKLKEGGSMTIYAPSGYCYGRSAIGPLKANSNLIFEIDLLIVNP